MVQLREKIEFGDFQTPFKLAIEITRFIQQIFPNPQIIIEPTCGLGSFIKASIDQWRDQCFYYGFDLNQNYLHQLRITLENNHNCYLENIDVFAKDWLSFFEEKKDKSILIIGNPPWVTNAKLGSLNSNNLPLKSNFQKLNGLDAKTGKANFDIAEWILIKLIDSLESLNFSNACIAMICKTTTARKVLKHFWLNNANIYDSSLHLIDAKKYFNVSVDTCLFITQIGKNINSKTATIYHDLSFNNKIQTFGLVNDELIANLDDFEKYKIIDGINPYQWRSGVKHDASKVMELTNNGDNLINGFGEVVEIEKNCLYPLLKSSDLANQRLIPRKFVIIPHNKIGEDTNKLKDNFPLTYQYLEKYGHILDNRKSSIYKKRPRFSIFGIGDYSFAPWKVAISGFYKKTTFFMIGQLENKPIMLDDTCYFIPCQSQKEAILITEKLNSQPCQDFLQSLIFFDAKRPITIDILKRINFDNLLKFNHQIN